MTPPLSLADNSVLSITPVTDSPTTINLHAAGFAFIDRVKTETPVFS
jgi:hypothetical protein